MSITTPGATARLQLHHGFTLDDAADLVPYLAKLGTTHVYSSPLLTARPGSMHGYDIVDHSSINPELGGEPALHRLVTALRRHDMGLIVDIVPNHMGVGGSDNKWWLDVLEWGRLSPYADFFDIDWAPPDPFLTNRVEVPFLGAPYGQCLAQGDIKLRFEPDTGRLAAAYAEHVFPITPRHYRLVFGDLVAGHTAAMGPQARRPAMRAAAAAMHRQLQDFAASTDGAAAISGSLERFDPVQSEGRARLHSLLERQHFRLVWWRAAADEINWRRFFDVTSLAGLRTELPTVFDATHALILRLYGEGLIDGVRIDHIDGLADPRAYCRKLRRRLMSAGLQRPPEAAVGAPYIIVEKILAGHERLPADWMTDGTTGYDFMDQVGALLHDPEGEAPLTELWNTLVGSNQSYATAERDARRLILRDTLASELNGTAAALHRVARRNLETRDYSLTAIRRALTEILVHFPVYRLYAGARGRGPADDRVFAWALAGARRTMRVADHPLLDQIDLWLGREAPRSLASLPARRDRLRALVRFEQLSSPVAAKSMEDTAFYRYGRLLSRNEVGSNPGQFALSPSSFHAACVARFKSFPTALLATATHDHKRGEDVRSRLAVLSEIPNEWAAQLQRWMRLNAPLRRTVDDGPAPDPADEIMLYQMLVGVWPPELAADDSDGINAFAERVAAWQEKAQREAKHHTAWVGPNEAYESACRNFLFQLLEQDRPARLLQEVAAFARRLSPAGFVNSLSQTILRLTTPGVPDLYQGTERWDFSLVDPDNRRPVDYQTRRALLDRSSLDGEPAGLDDWRSGEIKETVIARTLAYRRNNPALFAEGRYMPLRVAGPAASHVLAFARDHAGARVVVAVARLVAGLLEPEATSPRFVRQCWHRTRILLPRGWGANPAREILTGHEFRAGQHIAVDRLFGDLPVAIAAIG